MIIMPHPYGRMANRLLLSTAFIAHAEEQGDSFVHLAFADYFRFFEGTKHSPFIFYRSSTPQKKHKSRVLGSVNIWNTNDKRGETYFLDQKSFLELEQVTRFLFVIGWSFRAPQAVEKHKTLIRKIFTPIARYRDAVERLIQKAREGTDCLVGVHIRQTDYSNFANGKYFYSLAVYRRVMQDIQKQLKGRTRFLICSDSSVNYESFVGLDVFPSTGHPLQDNYALASCDLIVGPPSTYTAWASFYGDVPTFHVQTPDVSVEMSNFRVFTNG